MGAPARRSSSRRGAAPRGISPRGVAARRRIIRGLTRRVWLPAPLYELLPWLYCGLGAWALASALLRPDPAWLVPYLFLAAVSGVHLGLWCLMLRRRYRCRRLRRVRQRRLPATGAFPGGAAM